MKNRFNLNEEEKNRIKSLHNINVEQSKGISLTEDDSILDDAMRIVNEKTMLEKVELFRQLVSEKKTTLEAYTELLLKKKNKNLLNLNNILVLLRI